MGVPALTKAANAQYIYWNPGHANASDSNAGTDPNRPKASLNSAWAALRDGYGDWLLLAKGATYAEGFGSLAARNGQSAQYPIVVTTYDPADPTNTAKMRQGTATVATAPSGLVLDIGSSAARNTVFENVTFDKRNGSTSSVMILGPVTRNLMFYNVKFYRTSVAFQGDYAGTPNDRTATNIVVRRCVFAYGYSQGHSQGLFMWATDGVTVEDSVFYHNGWQGTDRNNAIDPPDIFKHNAYFGTMTFNTIFRRNVSAQASSHGLQMRGGGLVTDNVFANNPLNAHIGGGDHYDEMRPAGVPYTVTNNVVVGSVDIDAANPRGTGLSFSNTQSGGTASNNLVVNIGPLVATRFNQFALSAVAAFNQPTVVNWTNNIAWNWGSYSTADDMGTYPAQVRLSMSNSIMPNEAATNGNLKAPTTPFPDPNRTIATYASANGYASEQALWDYMIQHPEFNWAKLIGDYVRAGFGR